MELPSESALRFIVSKIAGLLANHAEAFETAVLVEPDSHYFPDKLSPDKPGIAALMQRVLSYTPVQDDVAFEIVWLEDAHVDGKGGAACGSGGCGSGGKIGAVDGVHEADDRYVVSVRPTDVKNPTLLMTSLVRSAGAIILSEAEYSVPQAERGAMSELCAVASGLGIVLLNGSAIFAKGCGGLRMHQATHLSVEELSVAVALVSALRGHKSRTITKHLEVTQREAFDEATRWVATNEELVERLRTHPESLEDGIFEFGKPKSFFQRLLGRKGNDAQPDVAPVVQTKQRSPAERERLAEARRLVEEALSARD